MALIVKRPWTRQPQVSAGVNWGNPIAQGLIDVFSAADRGINGQGFATSPSPNGIGAYGLSATAGGVITKPAVRNSGIGTIVFIANPTNNAVAEYFWDGVGSTSRDLLYRAITPAPDLGKYGWYIDSTLIADVNGNGAISSNWVDGSATCALRWEANAQSAWKGGDVFATFARTLPVATSVKQIRLFSRFNSVEGLISGSIIARFEWNRALSDREIKEVSANPWQLFAPLPRRIWAPVASGVVTHATSGALTGAPATLSGTAAHIAVHGSTGALAGAGSTLAGTAAHIVVHSSTGALSGAGSTLAGTAARLRAMASSGALAGAGATAAGTAARLRAMATSGALAGGGATIIGAAARAAAGVHDASGSLSAGGAALAGTAARIAPHATTGALAGAGATLAGTAAHVATHTTTGALVGAAAIVAGTAAHKVVHAVNGILVGGGAALTGMASRPAPASVSDTSAIGGPATSLFAELRGEVQYPSTRAAQTNWERFISSVKPTRID